MPRPSIGDRFPAAKLHDADGAAAGLPEIFSGAPATVIFFYRGRW